MATEREAARAMGQLLRSGDEEALALLATTLVDLGGKIPETARALGFKGPSSLWQIAYGKTDGSKQVRLILAECGRKVGRPPWKHVGHHCVGCDLDSESDECPRCGSVLP